MSHPSKIDPNEPRHWLDKPQTVNRIFYGLVAICVLLFVVDFVYHKHVHFGFEDWPGSYAVFGFVFFAVAVLVGKQLRHVLMRDEDYYDR